MMGLFTKLLLAGACLFAFAWVIVAQRRFVRKISDAYLRLTHFQRVLVMLAVVICTVYAQKPNTNDVVGTNGVVTSPPLMMGMSSPLTRGVLSHFPGSVSDKDIARGHRLASVVTNADYSYAMPSNGTVVGNWHLRGAYDDVVRADLGEFRFPFGTNLCSSLWAHTWGTALPRLRIFHSPFSIFNSNELVAVGAPMSAIPDVSRFWTAPTTNDTFLLTWQDFALGRIPASTNTSYLLPLTSYLFSAQIELKRNGDFFARSNNVESVYRRVNPDDWDDDGWCNADDPSPYEADAEDGFGPHQDLSFIVHSNNYYWVDLVVSNANALVAFESELPSDLPNPQFIARAGETNRVVLLLGKPYEVKCAQPIVCVECSHDDVDVTERGEDGLDICRPVVCTFVSMPLLMASPRGHGLLGLGGGSTIRLMPEPEGCEVSWGDCCCVARLGNGMPFFSCAGDCGCGGCAKSDISVAYDGTGLTFPGFSCPCAPEPLPDPDDPQDDPEGPSVSASFSRDAVIFEAAYTNMPGVVVPRRSTDVEVSYYVNGGTNGGAYAFTLVNGAKLIQVDGGTLPVTGHVAAAESFIVTARYEGRLASGSEGDIVAKAEFTEDETGQQLTDVHSRMTAVRLTLSAVYDAPENHNSSRHVYGVGEQVVFSVMPALEDVRITTVKLDSGDRECAYELFDGTNTSVDGSSEHIYVCPISSNYHPQIKLSYFGLEYVPTLLILEPQAVLTPEADWFGCHALGDVGQSTLVTTNYIGPMTVSFQGIKVAEIPCTEVIEPIGYFASTNSTAFSSHTVAAGAGHARRIQHGNRWTLDEAGGGLYRNWSEGRLEWKIPIGWFRVGRDEYDFGEVDLVERECAGVPGSRPLLIGDSTDMYRQIMTIEGDGTCKIEKFGHWLSRGRFCRIILDGETKQWTHWLWEEH